MKTITQTYHIEAPVSDVWRALVVPVVIDEWGGGPSEMDDQPGTHFTLWGGDVYGKNIEVEPEKKLVQEWYGGAWDEPSIVTLTLTETNGETDVQLLHEKVPDTDSVDIAEGWKEYYMGPLTEYVESK